MAVPNLRSLAGLIHPEWRGESTCEACGAAFTCGATLAGCWCTEVKLSDETRADLRTKYERCLCRECLEKGAAAQ
jgi:hypothetical protein